MTSSSLGRVASPSQRSIQPDSLPFSFDSAKVNPKCHINFFTEISFSPETSSLQELWHHFHNDVIVLLSCEVYWPAMWRSHNKSFLDGFWIKRSLYVTINIEIAGFWKVSNFRNVFLKKYFHKTCIIHKNINILGRLSKALTWRSCSKNINLSYTAQNHSSKRYWNILFIYGRWTYYRSWILTS